MSPFGNRRSPLPKSNDSAAEQRESPLPNNDLMAAHARSPRTSGICFSRGPREKAAPIAYSSTWMAGRSIPKMPWFQQARCRGRFPRSKSPCLFRRRPTPGTAFRRRHQVFHNGPGFQAMHPQNGWILIPRQALSCSPIGDRRETQRFLAALVIKGPRAGKREHFLQESAFHLGFAVRNQPPSTSTVPPPPQTAQGVAAWKAQASASTSARTTARNPDSSAASLGNGGLSRLLPPGVAVCDTRVTFVPRAEATSSNRYKGKKGPRSTNSRRLIRLHFPGGTRS